MRRVNTLLLIGLLASPPLVWHFPGSRADDLRGALVTARGDAPDHLMTSDELRAFVAAAPVPTELGCLADLRACADPAIEALGLLGAAGRVTATVVGGGTDFTVTLLRIAAAGGEPQAYEGRGTTLADAAREAFGQLRGNGTLELTVDPADAAIFLDDRLLGQGSGAYPGPPGAHRLRIEADGKRPIEQGVEITIGRTTTVSVDLPDAYGQLVLLLSPPGARVLVDQTPITDPSQTLELPPGAHRLCVEADGHDPYEADLVIKPRVQLDLTIGLQRSEPAWQAALRSPHADTTAHPFYLRADFRSGAILSGDVDTQTGRGDSRLDVQSQDASLGVAGLTIGAGWRSALLVVEALSLSFEGGPSAVDATVDGTPGRLRDPGRFTIRPGWVGARYDAWRLEPYAQGGVELTRESFDAKRGPGAYTSLTHWSVLLGLEFGVRYALTPDVFVGLAAQFDFLPGQRTQASLLIGGGYALELPEWL